MAIYEYECSNCGSQVEISHSMRDEPVKKCEKCGEETLKRLISKSSFALKGSGWYKDGYGSTK